MGSSSCASPKVTKNALLNAASIAGLLLTTEAMVVEIKKEKETDDSTVRTQSTGPEYRPPGGGMGGMM